jgi:hypothetical protein
MQTERSSLTDKLWNIYSIREAIILLTTKWWNFTKATVMEENRVSEGNSRSSSSKCQALSSTFNYCMIKLKNYSWSLVVTDNDVIGR